MAYIMILDHNIGMWVFVTLVKRTQLAIGSSSLGGQPDPRLVVEVPSVTQRLP